MSLNKKRTIVSKYFAMFFFVGGLSFFVELYLFFIFKEFFSLIFANVCARALALFFHFFLIRNYVFYSTRRTLSSIFYYAILGISNSLITGIFIQVSSTIFLGFGIIIIKIFFDLLLVTINYLIMKKFIFQ